MMSVRLKRISNEKRLTYAIIVSSNKLSPTSNNFIEKIGFYKPLVDKLQNKYVFVDFDRLSYWLKRGAKLNYSVFILIRPLILNSLKNFIE